LKTRGVAGRPSLQDLRCAFETTATAFALQPSGLRGEQTPCHLMSALRGKRTLRQVTNSVTNVKGDRSVVTVPVRHGEAHNLPLSGKEVVVRVH
jgi:hypothetical protein